MPENRNYKPFGTHAFDMTSLEPLTEYSRRYDTWREAERGHRETLERIRRDYARVRAVDQRADALAGAIEEVRLAISADLPALFQAEQRSGSEVSVLTPLIRADGTLIELVVTAGESEFIVTAPLDASPDGYSLALENLQPETLDLLCTALGLSVESGTLTRREGDSSQLGRALIRVAQAVACLSYLAHGSR